MKVSLARDLAQIKAALWGPSNVSLEEAVLWAARIGETLSDADQHLYDNFCRRSATSPLCRLVLEAAAAGETYPAPAAPSQPIPAAPQPGPKPPSLLEQMALELGVSAAEIKRGLDQSPPRADPASDPDDDEGLVGEAIPVVHARLFALRSLPSTP
jgi:hypothetical protein